MDLQSSRNKTQSTEVVTEFVYEYRNTMTYGIFITINSVYPKCI